MGPSIQQLLGNVLIGKGPERKMGERVRGRTRGEVDQVERKVKERLLKTEWEEVEDEEVFVS